MAEAIWLVLVLVDVGIVAYGIWVQNKARRVGDEAKVRGGRTISVIAGVSLLALVAFSFGVVLPD